MWLLSFIESRPMAHAQNKLCFTYACIFIERDGLRFYGKPIQRESHSNFMTIYLSLFFSVLLKCWLFLTFYIVVFMCHIYIRWTWCMRLSAQMALSFVCSFVHSLFFIYIRLPTCPSLTNATTYGACFYSGSTYPLHHKTKLITSQPSEA